MGWSVERTLGGSIALATAAMAVATLLTWSNSLYLERTVDEVRQTYRLRDSVEAVLLSMTELQSSTRGFIITGDERFLDPYHRAGQRIGRQLQDVRTQAAGSPFRQELAARLGTLIASQVQWRAHMVDTARLMASRRRRGS